MADIENRDIFQSYISKVFINTNTTNDDVVRITTKKFSPAGDIYELDLRVISPNIIQTEKNINELKPEISNVFPFKIVPPLDPDGSVIILSPTVETEVTASQNYYVPIYFERYDINILRQLDKEFVEFDQEDISDIELEEDIIEQDEIFPSDELELEQTARELQERLEREFINIITQTPTEQ